MAAENTGPILEECDLQHCLTQIYKTLLAASCLSSPNDPIKFLKNTLMAFQGQDNLQDIDWQKFAEDTKLSTTTTTFLTHRTVDNASMEPDDLLPFCLFEKAYSYYRNLLTSSCFRSWKRFTTMRKSDATDLALKMDMTKKHFEIKLQRVALYKWLNWVKLHKKTQSAAVRKLKRIINIGLLRRIVAAWHSVTKNSKRTKESFKSLEMEFVEIVSEDHHIREGCDRLSALPSSLSLKIFRYLQLRDWLNCAEVCCTWKAIIQSGMLWSQINFSVEKDWITDNAVKQILQNYRPFVIHLNLRGCTTLKPLSFKCISE
ncbi:hypothetical protein Q5P01_012333 [Channa striata]|uniref:F-box domain-containing protein n=1 Tax=Channa striata TaxID=64152 RepID=A0AA88MS99_CHASR|nr:hypothetical protein Q5P01_012333 [Channa striata]